jgi:hypothetical protein
MVFSGVNTSGCGTGTRCWLCTSHRLVVLAARGAVIPSIVSRRRATALTIELPASSWAATVGAFQVPRHDLCFPILCGDIVGQPMGSIVDRDPSTSCRLRITMHSRVAPGESGACSARIDADQTVIPADGLAGFYPASAPVA